MRTVRFAHLAQKPAWKVGDKVKQGDTIGKMGETGVATAAHLHLDLAKGIVPRNWKLIEAERGDIDPDPRELNKFIDPALFGGSVRVTTPYCDYDYQKTWGKVHYAYDLSTNEAWPWFIYWPLEQDGKFVLIEADDAYGWTALIVYDSKGGSCD